MSKMDAQRAMREAKFARAQRGAPDRSGTPARAPRPAGAPPATPARPTDDADPVETAGSDGLCGHRSMNGRTCTRESGHAQKSHRYG